MLERAGAGAARGMDTESRAEARTGCQRSGKMGQGPGQGWDRAPDSHGNIHGLGSVLGLLPNIPSDNPPISP